MDNIESKIKNSVEVGEGHKLICNTIKTILDETKQTFIADLGAELNQSLKNKTETSIQAIVTEQVRDFAIQFSADIGNLIYATKGQNEDTSQTIIEMVKTDISEGIKSMLAERTDNGLDKVYKSILEDVKNQLRDKLIEENNKGNMTSVTKKTNGGKITRKNRLRNRHRKTKKH